jgi:3-oxoacyl-[acyl-carrier protein] reductase
MASGKLDGTCALVTGASRGIGREIALRLARDGALVAIHYSRSEEQAAATLKSIEDEGGSAFLVKADLADVEAIERMFAALRSALSDRGVRALDTLVNNAGVAGLGDISTTDVALFDEIFDVNVRGCLFVTRHAIELMNDGGSIINMSSVVGHHGYPEFIAYAASKAAIDSMTVSMAAALGPRKIRVNAIAPGVTKTDMMAAGLSNDEFVKGRLAVTALEAIGEPADIASVAAFLASDDARWVTGERINVSGGMHL